MKKILLVAALAAASTTAFAQDPAYPADADVAAGSVVNNTTDRTQAFSGTRVEGQQGTVNFYGEVISQTCRIESGKENQHIALPKVATQAFEKAGDVAGDTPFAIYFDGCQATADYKISAAFINDKAQVDQNTGYLKNLFAFASDAYTPGTSTVDPLATGFVEGGATANAMPTEGTAAATARKITYSALSSAASGVEIMIADQAGEAIPLNGSSNFENQAVTITDGKVTQNFIARYVAVADQVSAGGVRAAIAYNIVYN